MKIKYVIYHIRHEYSNEIDYMNVLSECESFDNEQDAEKEIVKYLSKGECYTIMKVYYK
jgi:hypothetical protein